MLVFTVSCIILLELFDKCTILAYNKGMNNLAKGIFMLDTQIGLSPLTLCALNELSSVILHRNQTGISDVSITSLAQWSRPLDAQYMQIGKTLFLSLKYSNGTRYLLEPFAEGCMDDDIINAANRFPDTSFITVSEQTKDKLLRLFGKKYLSFAMSNYSDYVYRVSDIASPDYINNLHSYFRKEYMRRLHAEKKLEFTEYRDTIPYDVKDFFEHSYRQIKSDDANLIGGEYVGAKYLLDNISRVKTARFGALRMDGKVIGAICIGRINADICDITFVKNDHETRGSSILILHYGLSRLAADYAYYNFQEDMGIPGLKSFKERLNPVRKISKYLVVPAHCGIDEYTLGKIGTANPTNI